MTVRVADTTAGLADFGTATAELAEAEAEARRPSPVISGVRSAEKAAATMDCFT
jgi:hypothetical protein